MKKIIETIDFLFNNTGVRTAINYVNNLQEPFRSVGLIEILEKFDDKKWFHKSREVAELLPEPLRTVELVKIIEKNVEEGMIDSEIKEMCELLPEK